MAWRLALMSSALIRPVCLPAGTRLLRVIPMATAIRSVIRSRWLPGRLMAVCRLAPLILRAGGDRRLDRLHRLLDAETEQLLPGLDRFLLETADAKLMPEAQRLKRQIQRKLSGKKAAATA